MGLRIPHGVIPPAARFHSRILTGFGRARLLPSLFISPRLRTGSAGASPSRENETALVFVPVLLHNSMMGYARFPWERPGLSLSKRRRSSRDAKLAFYVTSHGFGHLNRTVAVINHVPADLPVVIRSHPNLFPHWRERLTRPAEL